jgi:hypothetical protein
VSAVVSFLDIFSVSYAHTLGIQYFRFPTSTLREYSLHPAKNRCEFYFHYDYGSLIGAGIKFKESISLNNRPRDALFKGLTANVNLRCGNKQDDSAIQSFARMMWIQQPHSDIIIGGDLTCIDQLYNERPSYVTSGNWLATHSNLYMLQNTNAFSSQA